jgi:hypothetical protein
LGAQVRRRLSRILKIATGPLTVAGASRLSAMVVQNNAMPLLKNAMVSYRTLSR